jgi:zinc protease
MAEIARLRDEPVGEAELAKVKRQIEVDLLSGMETANEMAARIAREYVNFGRIRSIDERLAAYAKVTAADVQRVAQTYFRDDKRTVVHVIAPPRAKETK